MSVAVRPTYRPGSATPATYGTSRPRLRRVRADPYRRDRPIGADSGASVDIMTRHIRYDFRMFEKCRSCGKKLVVVGSLCMMCFAGATTPADASAMPAPQHVIMVSTPPLDSELPHVAEEDFLTHVPASDASAGGGGRVVQGRAMLTGQGELNASGTTHRVGSSSLSGSGSLGGGGAGRPGGLSGEGHLQGGGVVAPAAMLTGRGSLSAG